MCQRSCQSAAHPEQLHQLRLPNAQRLSEARARQPAQLAQLRRPGRLPRPLQQPRQCRLRATRASAGGGPLMA